MLPNPPSDYPPAANIKKIPSGFWLVPWAEAIDKALAWILSKAEGASLRLDARTADGTMQSFTHSLGVEPSQVLVNVTKPPTKKIGMDDVVVPWEVIQGNHDKNVFRVRINFPTGATPPQFDIIGWP